MGKRLAAAAAAAVFCVWSAAHAQFKCAGADDKVAFPHVPCQGVEQRQDTVKPRDNGPWEQSISLEKQAVATKYKSMNDAAQMGDLGLASSAGFAWFFWLCAMVLLVLRVVLPFAVFGVKDLLRNLLAEQRCAKPWADTQRRRVGDFKSSIDSDDKSLTTMDTSGPSSRTAPFAPCRISRNFTRRASASMN